MDQQDWLLIWLALHIPAFFMYWDKEHFFLRVVMYSVSLTFSLGGIIVLVFLGYKLFT